MALISQISRVILLANKGLKSVNINTETNLPASLLEEDIVHY